MIFVNADPTAREVEVYIPTDQADVIIDTTKKVHLYAARLLVATMRAAAREKDGFRVRLGRNYLLGVMTQLREPVAGLESYMQVERQWIAWDIEQALTPHP